MPIPVIMVHRDSCTLCTYCTDSLHIITAHIIYVFMNYEQSVLGFIRELLLLVYSCTYISTLWTDAALKI